MIKELKQLNISHILCLNKKIVTYNSSSLYGGRERHERMLHCSTFPEDASGCLGNFLTAEKRSWYPHAWIPNERRIILRIHHNPCATEYVQIKSLPYFKVQQLNQSKENVLVTMPLPGMIASNLQNQISIRFRTSDTTSLNFALP